MSDRIKDFPRVVVEDVDGEDVTVEVGTDSAWRPCVKLTTRANATFDKASGYLAPDVARAIAAALTEAADEADLRLLEAAAEDCDICQTTAGCRCNEGNR